MTRQKVENRAAKRSHPQDDDAPLVPRKRGRPSGVRKAAEVEQAARDSLRDPAIDERLPGADTKIKAEPKVKTERKIKAEDKVKTNTPSAIDPPTTGRRRADANILANKFANEVDVKNECVKDEDKDENEDMRPLLAGDNEPRDDALVSSTVGDEDPEPAAPAAPTPSVPLSESATLPCCKAFTTWAFNFGKNNWRDLNMEFSGAKTSRCNACKSAGQPCFPVR